VGRFGHPKLGRFGLITWAVFDIRVGRFGYFPTTGSSSSVSSSCSSSVWFRVSGLVIINL